MISLELEYEISRLDLDDLLVVDGLLHERLMQLSKEGNNER